MLMNLMFLFLLCIISSAVFIYLSINVAHTLRIADHPDSEHKLHDTNTPFVGGVGVLVALGIAITFLISSYPDLFHKCLILGACSVIIFATGFADDLIKLNYKLRFVIQIIVALIMVLAGDVILRDFGGLFFGLPLQLGLFAVPITVFAVIGGINALNMIDGIDGLSGSISLVSLLLIGVVAYLAGDQQILILVTALVGGVLGFLYFNLRYYMQRYARVFLGDNGSMLLGLVFAWLLVNLSQGSNPAMTPVTAIWLFSIPLMDTISVMLRRAWLGRSLFSADRHHLHHLLQKAGFRVPEIVFCIVLLHVLFGVIGILGLYFGISETIMFFGFLLIFSGYFLLTLRPWHFVPLLRRFHILLNTRLVFVPVASPGTFFRNNTGKDTESIAKKVSEELGINMNYGVRVFMQPLESHDAEKNFAVILNVWPPEKECASEEKLKQYVASLQRRLRIHQRIQLRWLASRNGDGDPKVYRSGNIFGESKTASRRKLGPQALAFEVAYGFE